ncbi:high-potential iron-sulfur protein [Caballeronia sp. LZ035]|uniref:high-potential iron-sulfur protein n=1 Tax=Caballeronia sp. LZ035 TaxID=3038568 RepID=UPI0028677289|nr:high-potential iron-sulfur protein [Caballeronia sp. LZ035]MDR5760120.1 high-potential iron-sulfur protein [Caballeronia sp. LZ035]
MTFISRRSFMIAGAGALPALWLTRVRADAAHLSESDPAAVAVGYTENAAKVDKKKYPNYATDQTCANCSLFQGKSTDAWGGCTLFGDKLVAGRGWCSSWTNM